MAGSVHGDPLPLPVPCQVLRRPPESRRYLQQRARLKDCRDRCVRESVLALNALASAGAGAPQVPEARTTGEPTLSQDRVFSLLRARINEFPKDPEVRSDREAFSALLPLTSNYLETGLTSNFLSRLIMNKLKSIRNI